MRIEEPETAPTVKIGGAQHEIARGVPQATYPVEVEGTTEITVELPSVPTCTTPNGGRTVLGLNFAYSSGVHDRT